ncbi:MAG: ornithine cyclodeaminase family protein [Thermoprotei archaeon]|nr:MAG: ornithine cyclodeaminase family protein [Thermoprotei archaeon]
MEPLKLLYLQQEDVIAAGVLDMKKAVEDVELVLKMYARNEVYMPLKTLLDFYDNGEYRGHIVSMPVYVGGDVDIACIKWAAGYPRNPAKYGLPLGIDIIILSDPHNGRPLAIMDGTLITAARTAALAGIAVKYLKPSNTRTIGLIGAGVIGRTLLETLPIVVEGAEILLFDTKYNKAVEAATESSFKHKIRVVKSFEEAVNESDVVITATSAEKPFFKASHIGKARLYVQVGICEFEEEAILKASKIVVDNWEQIKRYERTALGKLYSKKVINDSDAIEIADVVSGRKKGRESGDEIIFFDTFGMACEDAIVAYRIYKTALEKGIGRELCLWNKPLWK